MSDLSEFVILDQLIQLIYLGPSRFFLLSTVDSSYKHWKVHLGLAGAEGRWWSGTWSIEDVHKVAGSKLTEEDMESFAENLKTTILQGDLRIDGWNSESTRGEGELELVFGAASKKPLRLALSALSAAAAASQATATFISIALQARNNNCELYPTNYAPPAPIPVSSMSTASRIKDTTTSRTDDSTSSLSRLAPIGSVPSRWTATSIPLAEHKELDAVQPAQTQKASSSTTIKQAIPQSVNPGAVKRPPKGASLANPNKKARKYQELEFEDD